MIAYDHNFDPPAPVVEVTLSNVVQQRRKVAITALVDTGSDVTAIPASLMEALQLYPVSRLQLEDLNARGQIVFSYAIGLSMAELQIPRLEIVLTGLDHAVLGRDVLNQFHLTLHGPELTFELSR